MLSPPTADNQTAHPAMQRSGRRRGSVSSCYPLSAQPASLHHQWRSCRDELRSDERADVVDRCYDKLAIAWASRIKRINPSIAVPSRAILPAVAIARQRRRRHRLPSPIGSLPTMPAPWQRHRALRPASAQLRLLNREGVRRIPLFETVIQSKIIESEVSRPPQRQRTRSMCGSRAEHQLPAPRPLIAQRSWVIAPQPRRRTVDWRAMSVSHLQAADPDDDLRDGADPADDPQDQRDSSSSRSTSVTTDSSTLFTRSKVAARAPGSRVPKPVEHAADFPGRS